MEVKATKPKVLAFGTGVFLRAFLCDFADRANVPVTLVSSTPAGDERARDLNRRGGRFTLAYRGVGADGTVTDTWRAVRSITRALPASTEWPAVLETARDPAISVVASNVSEVGFALSDDPDADRPDLSPPTSFPARLAAWLHARFTHFGGDVVAAGVVVLPCELIENNGARLLGMVDEVAQHGRLGDDFRGWLHNACPFADTLVDRIVPGVASDEERQTLWRERLGEDDALNDPLLTIAEPFALWAIQGDAALAKRLDWLIAGSDGAAVVTPDISPFVYRKVRILNGLHTAMAPIAMARYGLTHVRECLEHPELGPFLRALVDEEIVPAICPPLGESDARAYADTTWARMLNPFLVHPLSKIMTGAETKWETRLAPTMRAYQERFGAPPPRLSECRRTFEQMHPHGSKPAKVEPRPAFR